MTDTKEKMKSTYKACEAAEFLGVSTTTVMKWFHEGLFPKAYKIGRIVRIPRDDIKKLIKNSEL